MFPAWLALAQGGLQLGQAYSAAEAEKLEGEYRRQQYGFNKKLAEEQAEDAIKRGEKDASLLKKRGKQVKGAQRAALAAQGIEVDSGSAADLQADTDEAVQLDVQAAKNNAWREAWGYRAQALSYGFQGEMEYAASRTKARNTLITGGLGAIGSGIDAYGYRKGAKR